jgi:gamma-glutamylcyclotransferase (GGCT)/AIG2-like uncharacterized protein YtfP
MKEMLIMVYGTLMSGFGNNRLLVGQNLIGKCETNEEFALYKSGIPFVYPDKAVSKIKGELYKVEGEEAIRRMDSLEGHPRWYQRRETSVTCNGKEYTAWLYFYPHEEAMNNSLVINGDYRNPKFEQIKTEV